MRYFLLTLLFLGYYISNAQVVYPPTGTSMSLNRFKGGLIIDSIISVPKRDTGAWFGRHSDFISHNGVLKFWDGTQYKEIGGDGSGLSWNDTLLVIGTKSDLKNYVPNSPFIHSNATTSGTFFGDVDTIRATANFYINVASANRPAGMSYGGTASMIYQEDYHNGSMVVIGRGADDEFFYKRVENDVNGPWFRVASREYINSLGLAKDSLVVKYVDTISTIATQSQVNTFINQSTIQSVTITGDSLKTATFTRGNNSFISTTFVDKDNQTLAYNSGTKVLSIHNGNSIALPIDYGELDQVISGQTSSVFTLSQSINLSKHLIIMYNTANVYPQDYSITGPNQITFHFAVTASDKFHFFYKEN